MSVDRELHQVEQLKWLEAEPIPVFVYRGNGSGEILYANHEFLDLFECRSWDEFTAFKKGGTVREVIHKEDLHRVIDELHDQKDKNEYGVNKSQYRITTKSGKTAYIEDAEKAVMDPEFGRMIFVYMFHMSFRLGGYGIDPDTDLPGESHFMKHSDSQPEKLQQESGEERSNFYHNYISQMLDTALEKKWIKIYYQPIIRTLTGKLCGLEALARWDDPQHGFLSPADFIPVLEDTRQIYRLDLYMIEEHCKKLRGIADSGKEVGPASFNLSRSDFVECDIFAEVESILKKYRVERFMINIEITESIMLDDPQVQQGVDHFRAAGYEVWMDDFGSGYSSLNVLKDGHFDVIKLDMKFLKDLNPKGRSIIESIIMMAKKIGIRTLAEGVENLEQLYFLKSIGCEKVQGYLFGKPQSLTDTVKLCMRKGIVMEEKEWKPYYNKIGQINVLSDKAIGISEFDGESFRYLYVNRRFEEICFSAGIMSMNGFYRRVEDNDSPLIKKFKEFQKLLKKDGDEGVVDYTSNGQQFRLIIRRICAYRNKVTCRVEYMNLTLENDANDMGRTGTLWMKC